MSEDNSPIGSEFLVCGLGTLGQSCVSMLKSFGAIVYGIDCAEIRYWEVPDLPHKLDGYWQGDCRQVQILEQANVHRCRAILLVTRDERTNLAAAFAARTLNPTLRIIVRSRQDNLNQLLSRHLGNFAAFEPERLTAIALSAAATGDEVLGFFKLEGRLFRIVCQTIPTHHPWCDRRQLSELNASYRRIFSFARGTDPLPRGLHGWDTHTKVQADDRIAYVETTDTFAPEEDAGTSPPRKLNLSLSGIRALQSALNLRWKALSQTERAAVWCLFAILTLFSLGTLLYRLQYPQIGLSDAANATLVLLLGGFDNLFGQLKVPFFIPGWLHLFSLGLTLSGTVFIGVLYALLTEKVLAAKVSFLRSRPPIPQANHVAVIGLGQTGRQVATLLQELKYACVGVTDKDLPAETLPHLPLATGEFRMALTKANLATARSALVLTQDETTNLEIGLTIQSLNPNCRLVLRTADSQFGSHIVNLLTHAKAFSVEALAAEAFAAAAFGENVLGLFHLEQETVLAVEYRVEASDTLQGRLIGEVAYGYDVVPLLHGRSQDPATFMPSEDIRLRSNDRLIVLATGEGVQAIEHGRIVPPNWSVRVEKAFSDNAVFEGAAAIARLSGCELGVARHAMSQLPQVLPFFLYRLQAQRLVRELAKVQVVAQAMPAAVQL